MTGIAQWAVPIAERRRLRFSFQNNNVKEPVQNTRPQPGIRTTKPPEAQAVRFKGARFLKNRKPSVNRQLRTPFPATARRRGARCLETAAAPVNTLSAVKCCDQIAALQIAFQRLPENRSTLNVDPSWTLKSPPKQDLCAIQFRAQPSFGFSRPWPVSGASSSVRLADRPDVRERNSLSGAIITPTF